ncbi:MAG: class I lanthipeptide [Bacteroidales bacterium]
MEELNCLIFFTMKKKQINKKLELSKTNIASLNHNELIGIKGGDIPETVYPRCAISGCHGAQSCYPDTDESYCSCG